MSVLPMLGAAYVSNLLLGSGVDPWSLLAISLVGLFSLFMAVLGYHLMLRATSPIETVAVAAKRMAEGDMDHVPDARSDQADELQELSKSLKAISRNAKELLDKVDKLQVRDKLTGLYNATYIRERLTEEIERAIAYQRPCSFACLLIKNFDEYVFKNGESAGESALKELAGLFSAHLREFDRAARVGRGEFMIIFPDRNKKKCIEAVEKIAQALKDTTAKHSPLALELCAGISENPIDGVEADSLFVKAQDRMRGAKAQGKLHEAFV